MRTHGRVIRALAAPALVVAAALAVAPAASEAKTKAKALTCEAGRTVFTSGPTRLFAVARGVAWPSGRNPWLYACTSGTQKRPTLVYAPDDYTGVTYHGFRRVAGGLVAFAVSTGAETSCSVQVASINPRTRAVRRGYVDEENCPRVTAIAAAPDGSLVWAVPGDGGARIGVNNRSGKGLGPAKDLATVPGGIDPTTLAVAGGMVTWTTKAGQPGSVPLA